MFYSISSTQKGLSGIDLGNFLIKQARPSCMPILQAGPPFSCGSSVQGGCIVRSASAPVHCTR